MSSRPSRQTLSCHASSHLLVSWQRNLSWEHRKGLARQILTFPTMVISQLTYWRNNFKKKFYQMCSVLFEYICTCVCMYVYTLSRKSISLFILISLETTLLPTSWCLVAHTFIKGSDCFSVDHAQLQLENGADRSGIESLSVWSDEWDGANETVSGGRC